MHIQSLLSGYAPATRSSNNQANWIKLGHLHIISLSAVANEGKNGGMQKDWMGQI